MGAGEVIIGVSVGCAGICGICCCIPTRQAKLCFCQQDCEDDFCDDCRGFFSCFSKKVWWLSIVLWNKLAHFIKFFLFGWLLRRELPVATTSSWAAWNSCAMEDDDACCMDPENARCCFYHPVRHTCCRGLACCCCCCEDSAPVVPITTQPRGNTGPAIIVLPVERIQ